MFFILVPSSEPMLTWGGDPFLLSSSADEGTAVVQAAIVKV